MDQRTPRDPPEGFIGLESTGHNSVISDISVTNRVLRSASVIKPSVLASELTSLQNASSSQNLNTMSSQNPPSSTNASLIQNNGNASNTQKGPNQIGVSNFTLTSITGSATVSEPAQKQSKCVLCDQAIVDKTKSIKCSVCSKSTHFMCAASGAMDENVLKIIKNKPMAFFLCVRCTSAQSKGKIRIKDSEGKTVSAHTDELNKKLSYNEEYTRKLGLELDRVSEKNVQLSEQLVKSVNPETQKNEQNEILQQSLRAQLSSIAEQNKVLLSQNEMLQSKIRQNTSIVSDENQMNKTLIDVEAYEKDTIIAKKDEQINSLNEKINELNLHLNKFLNRMAGPGSSRTVGSVPSAKRLREEYENDINDVDMEAELIDIDDPPRVEQRTNE